MTAVRLEGAPEVKVTIPSLENFVGESWSRLWQQNVATEIRNQFYARGYPDTSVKIEAEPGEARAGVKPVAVVARVNTGPAVTVGQVRIEGAVKTAEAVAGWSRIAQLEPLRSGASQPFAVVAIDEEFARRIQLYDA